ncbi:MAG TPA: hypothetical protein VGR98_06660 [Streptosporangiaceae bacterium]|nr:hypothetical protein [Streptosporangiaceae bacterium]
MSRRTPTGTKASGPGAGPSVRPGGRDPVRLGELLDTGALLLGRRTGEMFTRIWPGREDDFSTKMNAIPKLVVSRSLDQADAWSNSAVLPGPRSYLWHAARADALRRLGQAEPARQELHLALEQAPTGPERRLLARRLAALTEPR